MTWRAANEFWSPSNRLKYEGQVLQDLQNHGRCENIPTFEGFIHLVSDMKFLIEHDNPVQLTKPVGVPLRTVVRETPLSGLPSLANVVMIGVHAALKHAHKAGYLHLDVNPSNIIIANRGAVLIDWGIARKFDGNGFKINSLVGVPDFCVVNLPDYATKHTDFAALPLTLHWILKGGREKMPSNDKRYEVIDYFVASGLTLLSDFDDCKVFFQLLLQLNHNKIL